MAVNKPRFNMNSNKTAPAGDAGYSSDGEDYDDEIMLFTMTDVDVDASNESLADQKDKEVVDNNKGRRSSKSFVTLRERRLMKAYSNTPAANLKSLAIQDALEIQNKVANERPKLKFKPKFERIMHKLRKEVDCWEQYHLEELETERAIRHTYNSLKKTWTEDTVLIKMEKTSFARGAMRQCYRVKKRHSAGISSSHGLDVNARNYVAKGYIEDVDRDVYFQDVKLQMDAKLWSEEYNKHNPPKKVDIFQMSLIEMSDRTGKPLFHLEHFIEGEYIKYNSNSGFVEEHHRNTPQAFSHFTFERSGHRMIVVDVQGVGDLYTDPQIHTAEGDDYGDGNLGPKGMALFFHSHVCNEICHSLDLSNFDLADTEIASCMEYVAKQKCSFTQLRGSSDHCLSTSPIDSFDMTEILGRHHSHSVSSQDDTCSVPRTPTSEDESMSLDSPIPFHRPSRIRWTSESEASASDSLTEDEERKMFSEAQKKRARPSTVLHELDLRKLSNLRIGDSVLGQIHHEMAKYHEIGRFAVEEDVIDWEAALFHEEHAANLGVLEAIITMGRLYLGLKRDLFANCVIKPNSDMIDTGLDFMVQAADAGDRNAMIFVAKAFQTGDNLGNNRSVSWEDSVMWYQRALERNDHDEGGEFDSTMDDPDYTLMEQQAIMLRTGGNGLDKDPQRAGDLYNEAAEAAMAGMKGRLANKFFMVAEECYGEMEEEEEEEAQA